MIAPFTRQTFRGVVFCKETYDPLCVHQFHSIFLV